MKKTNIVQFLPYFPPHKWGLETHAKQFWEKYVESVFWNVINVITSFEQENKITQDDQITFKWEVIWYKENGVENLVVPSFEIIPNFSTYKIFSKKFKLIKEYLKTKNINIVITRTRFFLTSFIWWRFAKRNKIKWVHIEHGSDYVKLSSNFKNLIAKIYDHTIWKRIFKNANQLVWVSNACKDFIQKEFVKRDVEVIYRWIELQEIDNKKEWELKLAFIWRLVKLKWVEDLLKSYKNLNINIWLDIIWNWDELSNLERYVFKNKLNNVKFLWFKDKKFIVNYLSKNKIILISPSYQEWLPTSVLEGLFYNNVVVASNVWWTSEISNKDDLILFEAWNIKQLTEKIKVAIKNYDKLVWKSKKTILEKFSWDKNIRDFYNLFSKNIK